MQFVFCTKRKKSSRGSEFQAKVAVRWHTCASLNYLKEHVVKLQNHHLRRQWWHSKLWSNHNIIIFVVYDGIQSCGQITKSPSSSSMMAFIIVTGWSFGAFLMCHVCTRFTTIHLRNICWSQSLLNVWQISLIIVSDWLQNMDNEHQWKAWRRMQRRRRSDLWERRSESICWDWAFSDRKQFLAKEHGCAIQDNHHALLLWNFLLLHGQRASTSFSSWGTHVSGTIHTSKPDTKQYQFQGLVLLCFHSIAALLEEGIPALQGTIWHAIQF